MKKFFAVIISVAMILSMSALFTSALDVVGDINITYDADASTKLNLNDGDISDWANAGYENKQYNGLTDSQYEDKMLVIRPVETKQVSLVTWIQIGWDVFATITIFFWIKGFIQKRKRG